MRALFGALGDVAAPVSGGEGCPFDCGLVGDADEVGQDRGGDLGGELEQGRVSGASGADAEDVHLESERCSGHGLAGVAAGEQPVAAGPGVGGGCPVGEEASDEGVDDGRHLDRGVGEGDQDAAVGFEPDLVGAHGHDAGDGLGEEQDEQSSDADVGTDGVLVEQLACLVPALFVSDHHVGTSLGTGREAEGGVDAAGAEPADELVAARRDAPAADDVGFQDRLGRGGRGDLMPGEVLQ